MIVTFTGTNLDKIKLLNFCKSIRNFRVDGPLTNETSVLIAKTGGMSEKYKAAIKIGIPIVKPDWIEYLYNNSSIDPRSDSSKSVMNSCLVHECCGWTISTTGFTPKEQSAIIGRISELGATYTASLTSSATCLIVKDLSATSAKLKAAQKWGNILIHDKDWLFDESRKCSLDLLHDSESVSILVQQSSFDQSLQSSFNQSLQPLSLVSRHEYKILNDELNPMNDCNEKLDRMNDDEIQKDNEKLNNYIENNHENPDQDNSRGADNLSDYLYLDECFIYLGEGFSDELVTHLRKIVRDCGGNLMTQCSDIVTHFLVSGLAVTCFDSEKITDEMHVVSYKWLSECYLQKKQLDPFQYFVDREPLKTLESKKAELNTLKQKNTMLKQNLSTDLKKKPTASTNNAKNNVKNDMMTLKSKKGSLEKTDEKMIFSGCFFSVMGFRKKENEIISKFIDELGGKVMLLTHLEDMLQKQEIYPEDSYLVKPLKNTNPPLLTDRKYFVDKVHLVTEFFIEKCIQDVTLYPPSQLCLFQPSQKQFPIPEFSSIVVGATGLTDQDKQWAERILSVLGGTLTHSFSRANTHLIFNPAVDLTGPKIEKAGEWGIPLVEMDWLYECIEKGCVVPLKKQHDVGKKELSLRTTKATKILQKNTMKTAKLFSERVFKGVSSTIQKVEEAKNQIEDRNQVLAEALSSKIVSPKPTKEDAEYVSLLKSTIEETLAHFTSKPPTVPNQDPIIPPKRRIIQESYDDKIDQPKKPKLLSFEENEKSPNQVTYVDADAKNEQMRLLQALAPAQPKFFMFSGINADSRPGLAETIKSLSGNVLETETWDMKCTHLLLSKVIKTEKFLAACASCAWILKADYIQECKTMNRWLDETKFIIQGNEFTDAAMHWKRQFINTGKKPFSGWKCCLSIEKNRKAGFERLLIAGGASLTDSIDEMFISHEHEDEKYYFFDKLSIETQTKIKSNHSTLKLRESSLIVEYLLSQGSVRIE